MPILKIAPGLVVNTDQVQCVEVMDHTDAYGEPHVVVQYKTYGRNIDPEYTLDEITAALNGKCYYRKQWTDEVGEIDVCVLHGNNSQWGPDTAEGPYRPCLTIRPYIEWTFPGGLQINHAPSIEHSWEYRQHEANKIEEKWVRENANQAAIDVETKLSPVAEYLARGGGLDHSGNGDDLITHPDPPHRPWWKRLFGNY